MTAQTVLRDVVDTFLDKRITVFVRCMSGLNAGALTLGAHGLLFRSDETAYKNPLFDQVFYFASPLAWGLGFLFPSLLFLIAAVSGRLAVYALAVISALLVLAGWFGMVGWQAYADDDAVLTSGALMLYGLSFGSVVGLAFSPRQAAHDKQVVAVTNNNEVVPLRSVG